MVTIVIIFILMVASTCLAGYVGEITNYKNKKVKLAFEYISIFLVVMSVLSGLAMAWVVLFQGKSCQ